MYGKLVRLPRRCRGPLGLKDQFRLRSALIAAPRLMPSSSGLHSKGMRLGSKRRNA